MEIIITRAQLQQNRACLVYLKSPEWVSDYGYGDGEGALVYKDWEASKARLLSSPETIEFLAFLVKRNLVPMSQEEFLQTRASQRQAIYDQIGRK